MNVRVAQVEWKYKEERYGIIFLVQFLATMEAVALLANDPIMSGRSIRSFRHLQCQNPSIISDSIGRDRIEEEKYLTPPQFTERERERENCGGGRVISSLYRALQQ